MLGKVASPQTLGRYVYCANNPLAYRDPSGRFVEILFGAIAGAIIGGVVAALMGGDITAGIIGGAVGGAIVGATMGMSHVAEGAMTANLAAAGAISGAASGAVQSGISTWDATGNLGAAFSSAAFGAIVGGATCAIGGVGLGRFLNDIAPVDSAYEFLTQKASIAFSGIRTSTYATKEGITEGVEMFSEHEATELGQGVASASLITVRTLYNLPTGVALKAGGTWLLNQAERRFG